MRLRVKAGEWSELVKLLVNSEQTEMTSYQRGNDLERLLMMTGGELNGEQRPTSGRRRRFFVQSASSSTQCSA